MSEARCEATCIVSRKGSVQNLKNIKDMGIKVYRHPAITVLRVLKEAFGDLLPSAHDFMSGR